MASNPYGASCGTSIVVAPSVAKVSTGKLGTSGARLSDTKSGKAPKRVRTKEELESMAIHPAGKKRDPLDHDEACKCYCTVVKAEHAELAELLEELDEIAENHRLKIHAEVEQRIADERRAGHYLEAGDAGVLKLVALTTEQVEYLRLKGDSDS